MATAPEDLFADSGALLRVCGEQRRVGAYAVADFEFERGTLRLSCDANTDEVLVNAPYARSSRQPGHSR